MRKMSVQPMVTINRHDEQGRIISRVPARFFPAQVVMPRVAINQHNESGEIVSFVAARFISAHALIEEGRSNAPAKIRSMLWRLNNLERVREHNRLSAARRRARERNR